MNLQLSLVGLLFFLSDEKNFKNPTVFDPENFAPENTPNKFGLMMFGQGPRNCIGMRYALLAIKIALVFLLRKYRLVPSAKTTEEIEVISLTIIVILLSL